MRRPTVTECRAALVSAPPTELPALIARFKGDERAGVIAAVRSAATRLERHRRERERLAALGAIERGLRSVGYTCVAGVDEVGRGALAGPLTVAAVILPPSATIEGLDDSKRLTPASRERVAELVRQTAVGVSIAHVPATDIDSSGIQASLRSAVEEALSALRPAPDHLLMDGRPLGEMPVPETAVVGGDATCAAIAAASVVAKVTRDALMLRYAETFPLYGFDVNKGYGTSDHIRAIATHGPCEIHRRSFAPCTSTMPLF